MSKSGSDKEYVFNRKCQIGMQIFVINWEFPVLFVLALYPEIQLCTLHARVHRTTGPNSLPRHCGVPQQTHMDITGFFFFLRKISPELTSIPILLYFICGTPTTAWLAKAVPCLHPGSEPVNPGAPKWNV